MTSDKKSLASSEGGASLRNTYSVSKGDDSKKKELWGTRHTFAFMGFLGFAALYGMRVNLSVAIVAMAAQNVTTNDNVNDSLLACPIPDDINNDDGYSQPGEFNWNEKTQGLILGSFYWGYACTNLLGGVAAERFGGKLVGGVGILVTSLLTLLTPVAARTSDGLFIALRVMEGMTEATSFPSVNSMMAAWVLPEERAKYSAVIFAGVQLGTVITLAASGFMCDSTFLGGWPSVFYVFGGLGVIWSVFWFPLVYDTPAQHPRISREELEYLKPITYLKTSAKTKKTPWRSIWTSKLVWTVVIMHFGYNWVFYTLLTELPTYLDKIQHFNLSSNGLLSALPYAIMYIYSLLHSLVMEKLTKNKTLTLLNVRRISMSVASFIPAVALIGMCFVGCDRVLAIVILCIAVGACGACYSGFLCSHVDLAPCYAGMLMGLTNTFGTFPGFISPAVTGVITNDNQTLQAWQSVFLLSAVITTVAAVIYIFAISADIQPWNYFNDRDEQQPLALVNAAAGFGTQNVQEPSALGSSPTISDEKDLPPYSTVMASAAGSREQDLSLFSEPISSVVSGEQDFPQSGEPKASSTVFSEQDLSQSSETKTSPTAAGEQDLSQSNETKTSSAVAGEQDLSKSSEPKAFSTVSGDQDLSQSSEMKTSPIVSGEQDLSQASEPKTSEAGSREGNLPQPTASVSTVEDLPKTHVSESSPDISKQQELSSVEQDKKD